MIRLQLLARADIERAIALMAIERAAGTTSVELVKPKLVVFPAGIKRRSPQTTNTERKLADLEHAVVEGLMTAREADRAFGRKLPGTGGRPRASGQKCFRAWLVQRIERLSDPGALQKLADRIAQLREDRGCTSLRGSLSRAKRAAMVREINRRSWQHDPEYVERLRAALAELDH